MRPEERRVRDEGWGGERGARRRLVAVARVRHDQGNVLLEQALGVFWKFRKTSVSLVFFPFERSARGLSIRPVFNLKLASRSTNRALHAAVEKGQLRVYAFRGEKKKKMENVIGKDGSSVDFDIGSRCGLMRNSVRQPILFSPREKRKRFEFKKKKRETDCDKQTYR